MRPIAIDGKAVRSAPGDTSSGCLHLVGAWAVENGVVLGQEEVPDGSHEIAAIPALLRVLDLNGALVTTDAAGCQKEIARQVREQGGDYLLAVKGNQPALQRAVHAAFGRAGEVEFAGWDQHESVEDGHGRHEERYVTVIRDPEGLPPGRAGDGAVVTVGREREVGGTNTSTARFYLTSLRPTAAELAGYIRGHWGWRTGCTGVSMLPFGRTRTGPGTRTPGPTLGWSGRWPRPLLKQDKAKGNIRTIMFHAAFGPKYLERVLQGFKAD